MTDEYIVGRISEVRMIPGQEETLYLALDYSESTFTLVFNTNDSDVKYYNVNQNLLPSPWISIKPGQFLAWTLISPNVWVRLLLPPKNTYISFCVKARFIAQDTKPTRNQWDD